MKRSSNANSRAETIRHINKRKQHQNPTARLKSHKVETSPNVLYKLLYEYRKKNKQQQNKTKKNPSLLVLLCFLKTHFVVTKQIAAGYKAAIAKRSTPYGRINASKGLHPRFLTASAS